MTIAARIVERSADLQISGDEVTGFVDRRRDRDAPGAQYLGVAVIEPHVARGIPHERPLGFGESVLGPWIRRGAVAVHVHDGYARDVGTIERYVQANIDCLTGVAPPPPLQPPGDVIDVDGGRAYLGPRAKAGPGTLGPGAVVLSGATVADGARVENAVVFEKEVVRPGSEVRDGVWIADRVVSS